MDQWLGDAKASKKYLLNMVQGKVEKMLLPDLLSCFVVYDKNIPYFYEILDRQNIFSSNKFLCALFPFFKQLLPEYPFDTENEFIERDDSYNDYDSYIAKKLRSIIFG